MTKKVRRILLLATLALPCALTACFSASDHPSSNNRNSGQSVVDPSQQPTPVNVAQAVVPVENCESTDTPERGLQGQVSLVERIAGFAGANCNLKLIGRFEGDGASFQHGSYKHCAYYGQAYAVAAVAPDSLRRPSLRTPGVVVVNAIDPSNPKAVAYLQSPAMLDPWESLKVHAGRGLLAAVNGTSSTNGGPQFDVYDIAKDCANPVLLASITMDDMKLKGHEGNWAPDGLTYYGADLENKIYYAIDLSDPTKPKYLTQWKVPEQDLGVHGMSFSKDGTRGYFILQGQGGANSRNGFGIYDLTAIQKRQNNPEVRLISTAFWNDGAWAQHTEPFSIKGRKYLVSIDEMGSDGAQSAAARYTTCQTGRLGFGIPRIFDITDEKNPTLVSKLALEIGQLENCLQASTDSSTSVIFSYDSHYCSVDNPDNATMLACSYFNSGLRLFDIRTPQKVKEIAYYNPAMTPGYKAGSTYAVTGLCAGADWSSSRPTIDTVKGQILFTSQCAGFQILQMSPSIFPLR